MWFLCVYGIFIVGMLHVRNIIKINPVHNELNWNVPIFASTTSPDTVILAVPKPITGLTFVDAELETGKPKFQPGNVNVPPIGIIGAFVVIVIF